MKIMEMDPQRILKFKALSEPIRIKMIPHLSEPRTVKQIADILGVDHHSLYHHMRVLEEAGIVKLVKTKKRGNITEKYYCLVDNWIVMPKLGEKYAEIHPLVRESAMSIIEDMNCSLQSGMEHGTIHRVYVRISPENIQNVKRRINQCLKEFVEKLEQLEDKNGSVVYSFNCIHFLLPESCMKELSK